MKRISIFAALAAAFLPGCASAAERDPAQARENMVLSVANLAATAGARGSRDIDARVLDVMRDVPRHRFVPADQRPYAYENRPLPIGHGATISQPYIVALMTDLLDLGPEHKVLEIGTGSGYQAAILGRLAGEIYTMEIVEPLAARAEATLRELGYGNVHVRAGDGYAGWPEAAPFDRIIVTAAPPEIPQALLDQLAPGGRMVVPVSHGREEELLVVDKGEDGRIRRRSVLPVRFVPMVRGGED